MTDKHRSYTEKDKFAAAMGVEFLEVSAEYSRCKMEIKEMHLNGLGSVHGGVIFAFGDITYAAACNSVNASIGMQADIRYLNKPKGTHLIGEAKAISVSNKIAHYEVEITDNEGTQVAQFSGITYRFPPRD